MFLKKLVIKNDGGLIREIPFKKGINFIVDNTPYTKGKESGNNVGKTTVLRLIDYCLGSKGKDIYSDIEFKESNNSVKQFLQGTNVLVELSLVNDFENPTEEIKITRNFLNYSAQLVKFNEEKISQARLLTILNKLLFNNSNAKPTFRGLIAKFIRDDSHKMSRTLKFLNYSTTNVLYEAIHLFLFGIYLETDLFSEKQWLTTKLSIEEKVLARLTEDFSENALRQALKIIERDIKILETEKESFQFENINQEEIEKLNRLKDWINESVSEVGITEMKVKLTEESIIAFQSRITNINIEEIKEIYENAVSLTNDSSKKFEDVLRFHNTMIENKIKFISKELLPLKAALHIQKEKLKALIKEESELSKKINLKVNLERYNQINIELNKKYELRGNKSERLTQIIDLKKSINDKNTRMSELNSTIETIEQVLNSNEEIFNKYFSKYSKELYDEEYFLSHDRDDNGNIVFTVSNIQANVGGGKKKGQIAAFDLAYIDFCEELNKVAPRFVLHDSTEDVSINQLMQIAELSSHVNGQYILAILKDKFTGQEETEKLINDNKIIELSQTDKLFKIP